MRKRTILSTVALMFVLASVAVAYYFVAGLGEGTTSQKLGKSTATAPYPITMTFEANMHPGQRSPLAITFNNTTGLATDVKKLTITPTTSVSGCLTSWFSIGNDGTKEIEALLNGGAAVGIHIPVGISTLKNDAGWSQEEVFVTFKEEEAVDQTACSEATLTLKAVATA